jgi:hypothetical protein
MHAHRFVLVWMVCTCQSALDCACPRHRLHRHGYGFHLCRIALVHISKALILITWLIPITQMPSAMYLVDAYTVHAASVTAASTIFRCLLGALLPLAGPTMYDTLSLGWGNSLLGFISIAFFSVPFFLYLYGERLRKSKVFNVEF